MKKFPTGTYGRSKLTFYPAPYRAPIRAFAALVIPWQENQILLANIGDRGWCIPSGRVEANETSMDAARREALEEAGATLGCLQYMGCYHISEKSEIRWADLYVADVTDLGEIQKKEESLGRQFVEREELPNVYYNWCQLTESIFEHAYGIIRRTRG